MAAWLSIQLLLVRLASRGSLTTSANFHRLGPLIALQVLRLYLWLDGKYPIGFILENNLYLSLPFLLAQNETSRELLDGRYLRLILLLPECISKHQHKKSFGFLLSVKRN